MFSVHDVVRSRNPTAPTAQPPAPESLQHAQAPVHDHRHASPEPSGAASTIDPQIDRRFVDDMRAGMEKMMRDMHAEAPSGDPDIDFLTMMIAHHWGAVEMARLALRDGRDPLVREMAEKILAAQLSEIEGMRGRLDMLRAADRPYPSLTGNRG